MAEQAGGARSVPLGGSALFASEFGGRSSQLMQLYAKGKQRQWDAEVRLDWDAPFDPEDPLGMPDEFVGIAGSPLWERLPEGERATVRRHTAAWMYSQFLHGEQGALICASKVVQTVPDLDAKFYAATQVVDEARHVEAFDRFIDERIGLRYPASPALGDLMDTIVRDSRWDFTYLGMQVLIEGLALASFGIQRDVMGDEFTRAFNAYVLQDEARHVAFGRIALRDHYRELSGSELRDREDFALETCAVMRDRFSGEEVWHHLDYGTEECIRLARRSPGLREFRRRLFVRVVPALKDIHLFTPRLQEGLDRLGVLGFGRLDSAALEREDERVAEEIDRHERRQRARDVAGAIELGAGGRQPA